MIDENGESLGEKSLVDAIRLAESKNLDLVCVAPNAKVPVCRFMDYSKYRYELQRKAREAKKNQKVVTVKEIRMTPVISGNDFDTKLRNGIKFLQDGDKLKVTLTFNRRARMLTTNNDVNYQILEKFIEKSSDYSVVEQKPTLEGRNISMVLSPKKDK